MSKRSNRQNNRQPQERQERRAENKEQVKQVSNQNNQGSGYQYTYQRSTGSNYRSTWSEEKDKDVIVAQKKIIRYDKVDTAIYERLQRHFYSLLPELSLCLTSDAQTLIYATRMLDHAVGTSRQYWYRQVRPERMTPVLGVAHIDYVADPNEFRLRHGKDSGLDYVFGGTCDDRIGVFTLLYLLPAMGIHLDVLLCDDEESGQSTGTLFADEIHRGTRTHRYNWMVEFDRAGDDVALYSYYSERTWREAVDGVFLESAHGSFTDITTMTELGICGMNVSCGYHRPHSSVSYTIVQQYLAQVARWITFYRKYRGKKFTYTPQPYRSNWSGKTEYGYYENDNEWRDWNREYLAPEEEFTESNGRLYRNGKSENEWTKEDWEVYEDWELDNQVKEQEEKDAASRRNALSRFNDKDNWQYLCPGDWGSLYKNKHGNFSIYWTDDKQDGKGFQPSWVDIDPAFAYKYMKESWVISREKYTLQLAKEKEITERTGGNLSGIPYKIMSSLYWSAEEGWHLRIFDENYKLERMTPLTEEGANTFAESYIDALIPENKRVTTRETPPALPAPTFSADDRLKELNRKKADRLAHSWYQLKGCLFRNEAGKYALMWWHHEDGTLARKVEFIGTQSAYMRLQCIREMEGGRITNEVQIEAFAAAYRERWMEKYPKDFIDPIKDCRRPE